MQHDLGLMMWLMLKLKNAIKLDSPDFRGKADENLSQIYQRYRFRSRLIRRTTCSQNEETSYESDSLKLL